MNPEFSFDAGDELGSSGPQVPWEFAEAKGLLEQEHKEQKTTTLDAKIKAQRTRLSKHKSTSRPVEKEQQVIYGDESDDASELDTNGEVEDASDVDDVNIARAEAAAAANAGNCMQDDDDDAADEEESSASELEERAERSLGASTRPLSDDEEENFGTRPLANGKPATKVKGKANSKPAAFFSTPDGVQFSAKSFNELHLSRPLLKACTALGYGIPTPIQAACIPLALSGRDVCGSAITGGGKTAAFALPMLERLLYRPKRVPAVRAVVLTPTRELAVQVHGMIQKLAQFTDVRACLIVGGLSVKAQEAALRTQPDIVVATPGRMIDHLHNTASVGLEDLAILILDEADRLLEMGFREEIKEVVRMCPKRRQTMLFSATLTDEVDALVQLSLSNPVRLSADAATVRPRTLSEEVVRVRADRATDREAMLLALCTRTFKSHTIVAHRLRIVFGLAGLRAGELHGNMTQAMRLEALEAFRRGETDFLIATDVAARGLDILGVRSVLNFDAPRTLTHYIHRVGRTARAGNDGCAVTFIQEEDRPLLKQMMKRAGRQLQSRVVPLQAVNVWRGKIENMARDIDGVLRQEREEKDMRVAEMEANKAANLIEHEEEIYARPAKSWFQTKKQKDELLKAAKESVVPKTSNGVNRSDADAAKAKANKKRQREKDKHMTRKQRRRKEALEAEQDEAGASEDEEGLANGNRARNNVLGKVRAVKGRERKQRVGLAVGPDPAKEQKGQDKKKKLKRKREAATAPATNGEALAADQPHAEDNASLPTLATSRGSGGTDLPTTVASTYAPKKPVKRVKPGAPSKRSFKSKAKYKRR
eukprot:jgi/Chlat1/8294/Chrsp78S07738